MTRGAARSESPAAGVSWFWIAAAMLVFAPLVRGGNRPLPLLVLECASLLAFVLAAFYGARDLQRVSLPPMLGWAILLLLVVPLIQRVPVPFGWWAALPGHEPYAQALRGATDPPAWHSVSLHARATEYAWLAMLPPLAVFGMVQAMGRRQLRRLVVIFVAVALLEAVLGLMQLGAAPGSPLTLGNRFGGGAATGTYVNKNHFAALMAMALPMLIALWAGEVVPARDANGEILREHPRHRDAKLARRLVLSVFVVVLVVALLFTRSRAGIGSGLMAFALASLTLVWNAGSRQARAVFAVVGIAALGLAAYVGLTPVLERFSPEELTVSYEGRLRIAAAAVRAALDFLPLGSGLGTFADAFPLYQGTSLPGFVDHAHDDYAEAFLELGVAGIAAIALLAAAYVMRWRELLRMPPSRGLGSLQVCAGLGMLALIVHAGFDFNFHIPANALYFAFLAGVFWFTPAGDRAPAAA
ncbi:MAG TPA: O-antigen ligase family protein [Usitatibacter sp.]|nr:O-antigen ligase family protein [Usitatibacter sp.]